MNRVPVGEVANFINGRAFKPSEWESDGLPIIRIQNLTESSTVVNYFSGEVDAKHLIERGDILVSWSASLGVYKWDGEDAVLNQHIFKVVPKENIVDKAYLYYATQSVIGEMLFKVHGSTMQHITKQPFLETEIMLPPLPEQKRIAAILEKADRLSRLGRLAGKLRETFLPSVFHEMFGDPVSNPRGWTYSILSDLGSLNRGKSKHRPRNAPELYGGPYPFIQTGDIANSSGYLRTYKQTYSEAGLLQSKMWPKGTLCITIAANIALTAITAFETCFPDSVVGFLSNERTTEEFIQYWFSFVQRVLEATAPESAQKNINLKILRSLEVPTPPIGLQQKFTEIVHDYEQLRLKQVESERQLDLLFQSLLHRAFRGEH